jgi:hypothetical protein
MKTVKKNLILGLGMFALVGINSCGSKSKDKADATLPLATWEEISPELLADFTNGCSEQALTANPFLDSRRINDMCSCLATKWLDSLDRTKVTEFRNQQRSAELDQYLSQKEAEIASDKTLISSCAASTAPKPEQ